MGHCQKNALVKTNISISTEYIGVIGKRLLGSWRFCHGHPHGHTEDRQQHVNDYHGGYLENRWIPNPGQNRHWNKYSEAILKPRLTYGTVVWRSRLEKRSWWHCCKEERQSQQLLSQVSKPPKPDNEKKLVKGKWYCGLRSEGILEMPTDRISWTYLLFFQEGRDQCPHLVYQQNSTAWHWVTKIVVSKILLTYILTPTSQIFLIDQSDYTN